MQAFFKKYNYKHEVLCIAADGPTGVAFSFVADTVGFCIAVQRHECLRAGRFALIKHAYTVEG